MKINVTPQIANEQVDKLSTALDDLSSVSNSIRYMKDELVEYWAAGNIDHQTFASGLEEEINMMNEYIECYKEFGQAIATYAKAQDTTSEKSAKN